ncbi:Alpha-galactosidase 3 [Diplonema papillatum]|nr:Alpha-galactosidase 3 [Diplonema papillatum]|eukprot:gene20018-30808_t
MRSQVCFVFTLLAALAAGIDNGLGLTPPMGWRTWNAYDRFVSQDLMLSVMDKMTARTFAVEGKPTSLLDLGYVSVGLDDNWQACGTGYMGSFHDQNGNPLVNKTTFPDMLGMTQYGHSLGLKVGWYMNNCICSEKQFVNDTAYRMLHMEQSVKAIAAYEFDGVKLDNCGEWTNLTWWAELLNATGRPVMIENCHWGDTVPGQTGGDGPCTGTTTPSNCPYNFFRSSGDIRNDWGAVFRNLQTTVKFQGNPPLSRPGTWAYPDMLEVGRMPNFFEDRAHFAAWCVVSAPLILSFDVLNDTLTESIWPIVANKELIAINQDWAGHPGSRIHGEATGSVFQIWSKPLTGGDAAVFVMNNATEPISVQLNFSAFGFGSTTYVRDVYTHADLGKFQDSYDTGSIASHDSRFYRLSAAM